MKYIYIFLFVLFSSLGVSAQKTTNELYDTTKELALEISNELNISQDNQVYLHRALYSTAISKDRAVKQYSNDPDMLEQTNSDIDEHFNKLLESKFNANQISAIKDLISAKAE